MVYAQNEELAHVRRQTGFKSNTNKTSGDKMQSRYLIVALFGFAACGGGSGSTQQNVGSAGATLKAGAATLTIPAGALTQSAQVTLHEATPQHPGRTERVEVEPHGMALALPALLSIQVDDNNAKVKMHGDDDGLVDVEVEDRNHHEYKTTMPALGDVEVELEHGAACATACASGQECDDGTCKAHNEDASAQACNPVCASGQECDDGACKTHNEVEGGGTGTCTPACATGLECDDGICKAHKGG
jgi:hypothetical protein